MTQIPAAAQAVNALLDRQRDLLCAIALTEESLAKHRQELAEVRASLTGVQLGQKLAAEATETRAATDA